MTAILVFGSRIRSQAGNTTEVTMDFRCRGGMLMMRRVTGWRTSGFRSRRESGYGHRRPDQPEARGRWPNRRHAADGFHRRMPRSAVDIGRRRRRQAADSRLVPHRDAAAAPDPNSRRIVELGRDWLRADRFHRASIAAPAAALL